MRGSRGYGKKSYGIPAGFKVNFTAMILHGKKTSQTVIFRWHCYKRRIKHKVYNIRFISRFRALLQILDSLPPWGWNRNGGNFECEDGWGWLETGGMCGDWRQVQFQSRSVGPLCEILGRNCLEIKKTAKSDMNL